jgi:hypothetical protein
MTKGYLYSIPFRWLVAGAALGLILPGSDAALAASSPLPLPILAATAPTSAVPALPAAPILPATAGAMTTSRRSAATRLAVSALKIVNYYPAKAGWRLMWTDYSHATTVSDFKAIASLGANTVRVIVQPSAVGFPTVVPSMRADLGDMLNVAAADGLYVQLSLFDQWHGYTDIAGSERWLVSLLADQRNNPTIALVELQNEMFLTSQAIHWADTMLPFLQTVLPGVPRTVSEPSSGGLSAIRALLDDIPRSDIDAIDVHYYGDPAQAAIELQQVKALAGRMPVFVGETGLSTLGTAAGEEAQTRFYEVMGETTHDLGLPPPAPWMLNDVTRAIGEDLTPVQEYYGLRRPDGTWKPAAAVVRALFNGGTPEDWDGSFAHEYNGNLTLGAWTAFDPAAGMPVVTRSISAPGNGAQQSVCYSGTGGTTSAVPAIEQSFPVLRTDETFTVSAFVERFHATGWEQVSIAEYNEAGSYLGQRQSPLAWGSGTWQPLQVSLTVPSGVTSVQVNLKAANESGEACWGKVTVTQSAP